MAIQKLSVPALSPPLRLGYFLLVDNFANFIDKISGILSIARHKACVTILGGDGLRFCAG
jgi:hypothetical protein